MIKAVLFDLDETLIDRTPAIRAFVADQYQRFSPRFTGVTAQTYADRYLAVEDHGLVAKTAVYPALAAEFGWSDALADELLDDYRTRYPHFAQPMTGALELLKALRQSGLRLGIVTNGNVTVQQGKIDLTGIGALIDTAIISEAVNLRKPDPAIYALAAERLGVSIGDCLFIGDNPRVDVLGAQAAGLQAAWFKGFLPWPQDIPAPDHAIDRLDDVMALAAKS